jgi:D-alanyl-D-alanine carboxypeptidase (penicillin-binding protein 5/6)
VPCPRRLGVFRATIPLAAAALLTLPAASQSAPAPRLDAASWILVNPATGEVLAQHAPDRKLPMASTTKIMTALLVLEHGRLDATVTVPSDAATIGGSTAELVPGERLSVRNLLVALLIPSGNDAAVTLADYLGDGSRGAFVAMMNRRAAQLGLRRTRYESPDGLDRPGQYSTVRNLVRLARVAMTHPLFRSIVSHRRATIPGPGGRGTRRLESENDLLSIDPDADGVKTGHTSGAGYAMVAHAERPRLGLALYAAIIGEPTELQRARDAERLLDWGFARYARPTELRAGQVLARASVRDRPGVRVSLRVARPLAAVVRLGEPLRASIVVPPEVTAPIRAGQMLGQVTVRAGGRVLGRRPLVAATNVAAPGLLDRLHAGWDRLVP